MAEEDTIPEGETRSRRPRGEKQFSLGPTHPGARMPAQEFQKHLVPKPGSEPKVYHQGEASSFQIQRPTSPQSRLTKDYDRDEEDEEEEADDDRYMLTAMLGLCPKCFAFITLLICPNKAVRVVKAMVFLVVMYKCESWIIRKAEHHRTEAFDCGVGEDP